MELDYSGWQLVAIFATFLFAATAKGVTGLGFSTVSLPLLALSVGLKEALPLVIIPSVASNLTVMFQAGRFRETLLRFWPMLLATIPGLVLGLWALALVDGPQAGGILGIVLLLWCAFAYAKPNVHLPSGWERRLGPISGFCTGVVNGVTGSQVMPCMPYLMALNVERNLFLQAINCSFTLSSLIMAIGLTRLGVFTTDAVLVSVAGAMIAFFGLALGAKVRARLSAEAFRLALIAMLVAMAFSLIVRAI